MGNETQDNQIQDNETQDNETQKADAGTQFAIYDLFTPERQLLIFLSLYVKNEDATFFLSLGIFLILDTICLSYNLLHSRQIISYRFSHL